MYVKCVCIYVRMCVGIYSFFLSSQHHACTITRDDSTTSSYPTVANIIYFFSLLPYFCSCWPIIGRGSVNLTINQTHNKFVGRRFSLPFILFFFFAQNLFGDKKNIISWISFSKNNIYTHTFMNA